MGALKDTDMVFRDQTTGEYHGVEILKEDFSNLKEDDWYVVGDYVYHYIGEAYSLDERKPGTIYLFNGKYHVEEFSEDDARKDIYSKNNIMTRDEYDSLTSTSSDLEELLEEYCIEYEKGNNLTLQTVNNITVSGDIFLPELKPDDDPFEKVIKSMLLHKKVVLNSKKGDVEKGHVIDNLRSALNGATKNMSITKFLLWNKVLDLHWEIRLSNADDDVPHPLKEEIWLSDERDINIDIAPAEDKSIFVVKLEPDDDPLKKLIKLALDQKRINTKEYEGKSSSAHLINNLKSALKSKQKMTLLYFITWCELIDMIYEITVTDKESGIYFKVIGYDLYTNLETVDPNTQKPIEEGGSGAYES